MKKRQSSSGLHAILCRSFMHRAAETKLVVATRHAPGDPDLLALAEAFEKNIPM